MIVHKFLSQLDKRIDDATDYFLPSTVNEAKQLINSKAFANSFFLGAICIAIITIFTYFISLQTSDSRVGLNSLYSYILILNFASIVVIPFLLFQNLNQEINNGNFELLKITGVSPYKILLGKWQTGLFLTGLVCSFILPLMIFSYLLGGVDIFLVIISFLITLILSQFNILIAIFLCSLSDSKASRLFSQIFFLVFSVYLFAMVTTIVIYDFTHNLSYFKEVILNRNFIGMSLIGGVLLATFEILLFVISAKKYMGNSTNKSSLPRMIYSFLILEICLFSLVLFSIDKNWIIFVLIFHFIFNYFFLLESDTLPQRIRQQLLKKGSLLSYLFKKCYYPSSSRAYFFLLFNTFVLYLFAFICNYYFHKIQDDLFIYFFKKLCVIIFNLSILYLLNLAIRYFFKKSSTPILIVINFSFLLIYSFLSLYNHELWNITILADLSVFSFSAEDSITFDLLIVCAVILILSVFIANHKTRNLPNKVILSLENDRNLS